MFLFEIFFGRYLTQDSFSFNREMFERTMRAHEIVFYASFVLSSASIFFSKAYRKKIRSTILYYFIMTLIIVMNYFIFLFYSLLLLMLFGGRV